MSQDSCPSSGTKEGVGVNGVRARDVSASTGRSFWRSVDDLMGTREFRDFLEREFPACASELRDGSRRHFLRVMGASLALAGAASIPGCRRPDHRILAYNKPPEHVIPGKPLYYATAMPMPGGGCQGLLAETFEGRPTKVEGNPLHPRNKGKSSVWAQASVLDLYDPERDPASIRERDEWSEDPKDPNSGLKDLDFMRRFAPSHFGAYDRTEGAGLAFLVEKATSPSRDRLRTRITSRWPRAKWFAYEGVDRENTLEGSRLAFGRTVREEPDLRRAKVILSLDRDFLGGEGDLRLERDWAASRFRAGTLPGRAAADSEMSRLYTVETDMTLSGAAADHRLALRPARVGDFTIALAGAVLSRLGETRGSEPLREALGAAGTPAGDVPRQWLDAVADDLISHRADCLVLVGERQDPAIHALGHALNAALGNVGRTVSYRRVDGDASVSSRRSIEALAAAMSAGEVDTLVMIGVNPVYDAPADVDFSGLLGGVRTSVYLGDANETALASRIFLPRAHFLESWGDVQDWDGSYSVVQPMIEPLWGATTELGLLALLAGLGTTDGYEIVRDTLAGRLGIARTVGGTSVPNPEFESRWRRCLHDGVLPGSEGSIRSEAMGLRPADVGAALRARPGAPADGSGFDVVFAPCSKVHDGRWANNAWLRELPHQVTKVAWDNPALISSRTAERLGLNPGRKLGGPQYNKVQMVDLMVAGRTLRLPIWVQPGLADDTVVLHLGHGRRFGGRVAESEGFDAFALRASGGMWVAAGESIAPAKGVGPYLIANVQDHWAIEGRDVFREVDHYWWKLRGDEVIRGHDAYGNDRVSTGAERLGMESHTPVNRDIYKSAPGRGSSIYYHKVDEDGNAVLDAKGRRQRPENKWGRPIQQWGMSIDLTTCTGCGACTTACQAENNIPVVGKMEVAKGREMHWIRVDRYYASDKMDADAFDHPDMVIQPVLCMHCENAPCEVVCPVNATVHGTQGTNDMAYNRCIGTRYCSNNCPYKVRRFNYFDYATKRLMGRTSLDAALPEGTNPALVPPRLREKITAVEGMRHNPHVTVRSRGVMEKCTYCIQRINSARVETKLADLDMIPDGFFQAACQQACPTGAIVFGDIYDYASNGGAGSAVHQAKSDPRTYAMLAYLNVHPRTSYQLRVRNPNERLRPRSPDPFEHHHGAGHGHDHDHDDHGEGHVMRLPVLSAAGVPA